MPFFATDLSGQVPSFGGDAADAYAEIAAARRTVGKPISQFDAICRYCSRTVLAWQCYESLREVITQKFRTVI